MSKSKSTNPQNLQATSKAETETAEVKRINNSVTALAALYQAEKADPLNLFNTNLVIMGAIAVTYPVGALQIMDHISHGPITWLFLLLLPAPLWLIVAFHSLMTLNAQSHGISVRIIEDALFEASELRVGRELVGSAAGDKIMDITQSKAIHKLITAVIYGGVADLDIGFTGFALYSANRIIQNDIVLVHARVIWVAIGTYLLLMIMVALSWIVGLRIIAKGSALTHRYPSWSVRSDPPVR
jgi:hypothetical protein